MENQEDLDRLAKRIGLTRFSDQLKFKNGIKLLKSEPEEPKPNQMEMSLVSEFQKPVNKIICNAKKNLERELAKNSKNNPCQFYSYLNRSTKSTTQVGPLKNEKTKYTMDPRIYFLMETNK